MVAVLAPISGRTESLIALKSVTVDIPRPAIPSAVVALMTRKESSDRPSQMGDVLADESSTSPEEIATTRTMKREVQEVLEDVLTPRERLVLQMRFGLGKAGRTYPLEQVGRKLGITRERVRQIEAQALRRLAEDEDLAAAA